MGAVPPKTSPTLVTTHDSSSATWRVTMQPMTISPLPRGPLHLPILLFARAQNSFTHDFLQPNPSCCPDRSQTREREICERGGKREIANERESKILRELDWFIRRESSPVGVGCNLFHRSGRRHPISGSHNNNNKTICCCCGSLMAHQVSIDDSTISSGKVFWARNVSDLCVGLFLFFWKKIYGGVFHHLPEVYFCFSSHFHDVWWW